MSLIINPHRFAAPAGGSFDPASIFGGSDTGGFYDPSDSSTVFQDRNGASSTIAAGANDPVGTILDNSGKGNHLIATADANRPILRQGGGLSYLEFDGANDFLEAENVNIASSTLYAIVGWRATSTNNTDRIISCGDNSLLRDWDRDQHTALMHKYAGSNRWQAFRSLDDRAGVSFATGADVVLESGFNATNHYFNLNGGIDVNSAHAAQSNFDIVDYRLGGHCSSSPSPVEQASGRLYATLIIDRLPTSAERDDLQAWFADKSGVAI